MLSDVFPTGWHGVELSGFQVGDRVAVFGGGPVGLMAAHSGGRGVEAVGYQAHDGTGEEHPELVLDDLAQVVRATGGIGVVGVYMPDDPGASSDLAKEGRIPWQFGTFFTKGQSMGTGQAPVKRYDRQLRDLVTAGKANPGAIVSHHLSLDEAVEGYRHFDDRDPGWTKVLLRPAGV